MRRDGMPRVLGSAEGYGEQREKIGCLALKMILMKMAMVIMMVFRDRDREESQVTKKAKNIVSRV